MRKFLSVALAIGIIGLLITTVLGQYQTPIPTTTMVNKTNKTVLEPKAEGKALYDYFTKENNYKNWNKWPGKEDFYPKSAGSPHGDFLITYVSDNAISTIQRKMGELPDETIIIKENYDTNKKLAALTVMYKENGYDSNNNDWFWARYDSNGSVLADGKIEGCINCHATVKDNDYIFASELNAAPPKSTETPIQTTAMPTAVKTTQPKTSGFEVIIGIIAISLISILGKIGRTKR